MVKKLIKHDIRAFARTMLPVEIIVVALGLFCRFIQFFESRTTAYEIAQFSAIAAFVLAILAALFMAFFTGVSRFYKNLFTNEGYLSMTLPVTPAQHILSKTVVSLLYTVLTCLVILLSASLASMGELLFETVKAGNYLLGKLISLVGGTNFAFWIVEGILLLCVYTVNTYLLWYACLSIGQRAKKNRALAGVGVYFAYYFIRQIFGTFLVILFTVFAQTELFRSIGYYLDRHPVFTIHTFLIGFTVIYVLFSLLYFAIANRMLSKKLNLE